MAIFIGEDLFHHKTVERIQEAERSHDAMQHLPERKGSLDECIYFAGQVYRSFLEDVISGGYVPNISQEQRNIFVEEAYKKSDFDWKDREKFYIFFNWINDERSKLHEGKKESDKR